MDEGEAQYGRDLMERTEALYEQHIEAERRIHAFQCTLNEMMEAEAKADAALRQAIQDCMVALSRLGNHT